MNRGKKLQEWLDSVPDKDLREIALEVIARMIETEEICFYPEEGKILSPYWDASGDELYEGESKLIKKQSNNYSLYDNIRERYEPLLTKTYKYQMGDDDYVLTTEELTISRALQTILHDLKK